MQQQQSADRLQDSSPDKLVKEQEDSLRRKYGNLPDKRHLLQQRLKANHMHERKFFDSADATLAKQGKELAEEVGVEHAYPTSEDECSDASSRSSGSSSRNPQNLTKHQQHLELGPTKANPDTEASAK
ncbi:hypothetical protein GAYE_PCTG10G0492 [Galdieria yellowstonensis]|uniref:mRNA stability protein n=1 Tax=Galdieria yellowstonensis TaxID=3028027 RepID=A0AAV9I3J5_9RHOD|nr:hypothetical protein GAYE_PCTG10G0492 [Galdieria yellowstonensis]